MARARFAVMANWPILTDRGEDGGNDVSVVKEMEGAKAKLKPEEPEPAKATLKER